MAPQPWFHRDIATADSISARSLVACPSAGALRWPDFIFFGCPGNGQEESRPDQAAPTDIGWLDRQRTACGETDDAGRLVANTSAFSCEVARSFRRPRRVGFPLDDHFRKSRRTRSPSDASKVVGGHHLTMSVLRSGPRNHPRFWTRPKTNSPQHIRTIGELQPKEAT